MSIRIRKLIGAVALLLLVIVWALVAMAIAQFPPIFNNGWIAGAYYVVAGTRLGAAGNAIDQMDVREAHHVTLMGRKPFHSEVAAPDTRTRA